MTIEEFKDAVIGLELDIGGLEGEVDVEGPFLMKSLPNLDARIGDL